MTGAIRATVTTPSGQPLEGAAVTVMSQDGEQCAVIRTDADGVVSAEDLVPGTYTVVMSASGFDPVARVAVLTGASDVRLGRIAASRSTAAPLPKPGRYEIDPGHSRIEISVRHFGISTIRGRFTEFAGQFEVAADLESSSVAGEIKTASIDTDNQMRDDHLRSDVFFDVEQHPTARFAAAGVRPAADETWALAGTLSLRGVDVPVTLAVQFLGQVDDPWGAQRAAFRATGELHRGDFGITFDDRLVSGAAQIGSTARLVVEIEAVHTG